MEYGSVHPETQAVDSAMRSRVCRTSTSQEELQDLPAGHFCFMECVSP